MKLIGNTPLVKLNYLAGMSGFQRAEESSMNRKWIAAALLAVLCCCGTAAAVQVKSVPEAREFLAGPGTLEELQAVDRNDPAALLDCNLFLGLLVWSEVNGDAVVEEFLASVPAENRGYVAPADADLAHYAAWRGEDPDAAAARFDEAMRNLDAVIERDAVRAVSLQRARIEVLSSGVRLCDEFARRWNDSLSGWQGDEADQRRFTEKRRRLVADRAEAIHAFEEATGEKLDLLPIEDEVETKSAASDESDDEGFASRSVNPKIVFFARPEYPEEARVARVSGTVIVKVLIGPDGAVVKAELLQSVHPLLDEAAIEAAKRSRFEPGTQRGIAVHAWMALPFAFRLEEDEKESGEEQGGESNEG